MKATIEVDGTIVDVKLRNLSAQGALIEGEGLPPAETRLTFRRDKLSVPGRVAWSERGRAGIAFAQALEPDVVLRHVPQPRPRMQAVNRRPGLTSSQLSKGEQRYVEDWLLPRS